MECLFAGVAFLETDAERLLSLEGAPAHLREILQRNPAGLEAEYVRLFLSPTGSVCSLWQSAYEGERTLMGEAHVSALNWYGRYGAAPKLSGDPADHVGMLLTFYAQMMVAGAAPEELERFADRHLGWIPAFAESVATNARHEFYRELGRWVTEVTSVCPTCSQPARTVS